MAEYIEREKAIELIRLNYCKDCNSYNGVRCRACSFDDAMLALEDVPTADVVEVVRCKDCKKAYINSFSAQSGLALCRFWTNKANEQMVVRHNDFCSYGERSETNAE